MRPVILISTDISYGENKRTSYETSKYYADSIAKAGAIPILYGGGDMEELTTLSHGLLLTGGGDLHPSYYGEEKLHPMSIRMERDRYEMKLLESFLKQGKPVFGICRGMQLINVAFGGTLFQDIKAQTGLSHESRNHWVTMSPSSALAKELGRKCYVNSYHHQAIKTVGKQLSVIAVCDEDGIIEGVECEAENILGVQWHPERMVPGVCQDGPHNMLPLFAFFTNKCTSLF